MKIGKKSFMARVPGTGCARRKRKDGIQRQKPHWGPKASAKASKNAKRNSVFQQFRKALPNATRMCIKSGKKPFTKSMGACIRGVLKNVKT